MLNVQANVMIEQNINEIAKLKQTFSAGEMAISQNDWPELMNQFE